MEQNKESIDGFCRQIIGDAEGEAKKILENAQRVAGERQKSARTEVERYRRELDKKTRDQAEKIKKRILSSLNLESKKIFLKGKGDLVAEGIARLRQKFDEFTRSESYRDFLKELIVEGVSALPGYEFTVEVSEANSGRADNEMLKEIETEFAEKDGRAISLHLADGKLTDTAGVKIYTADGRTLYDNTVVSIFNRYKEDLRLFMHKELFK